MGELLAGVVYSIAFGAITVYGLIVLFNSRVSRTFKMVSEGATLNEAVRRSAHGYGDIRDDYDEMFESPREWEEDRGRRRAQDDGFRRDLDENAGQ